MNKRIKELAEQADVKWLLEHHPKLEKFAELIVKECLAQIVKVLDSCDGNEAEQELGALWAGLAVARHFGVEE